MDTESGIRRHLQARLAESFQDGPLSAELQDLVLRQLAPTTGEFFFFCDFIFLLFVSSDVFAGGFGSSVVVGLGCRRSLTL